MDKKYSLVIFDLDGTILDTLEDLTDCLNHTLLEFGFPQRRLDEVRSFVGDGIRKLIERAAPKNTESEIIDKVFISFKEYYKDHFAVKTRPYDGIPELLMELRKSKVRTAVVSNKADFAVKALCEKYFPGMFDTAVGEREGIARKPVPDSVNAVLAELGVSRQNAVYVGDSDVDIATAANAEMDCISVAWGFRDEAFLRERGAECLVYTVDELKKHITE